MNYQLDVLINGNTVYENVSTFTIEGEYFCIQFADGREGNYKNVNSVKPVVREIVFS